MLFQCISDIVNIKESVLPLYDKPYHTDNRILQKWEKPEHLRNYALIDAYISSIQIAIYISVLFNEVVYLNMCLTVLYVFDCFTLERKLQNV